MLRLLLSVFCIVLFVGCDSGDDSDSALLGVTVETPSGTPVGGLDLSMEYALGDGDEGGDRSAPSTGLLHSVLDAHPAETALRVPYPNPFFGATTIEFELSQAMEVTLDVLDLEHRLMHEIVRGERPVGRHQTLWEATPSLTGGFYRVRLTAGEDTASVLAVYTGSGTGPQDERLHVRTALGQTDAAGRFVTEDCAFFPQLYDGIETEFRDENNGFLGVVRPSREVTFVLRDGAGREQRYERTLTGAANRFDLRWDPE